MPIKPEDAPAVALLYAVYEQHRASLPAQHQDHTPESCWLSCPESTRALYRKLAAGEVVKVHVGDDVEHGVVTSMGGASYPYTSETIGDVRRITVEVPVGIRAVDAERAARLAIDDSPRHEWKWIWNGTAPHLTNGVTTLSPFPTFALITIQTTTGERAFAYVGWDVLREFLDPKKRGEPP